MGGSVREGGALSPFSREEWGDLGRAASGCTTATCVPSTTRADQGVAPLPSGARMALPLFKPASFSDRQLLHFKLSH